MSEEVNDELDRERWFIDLDWYQANKRSFSTLAQRCLCDKCLKDLKTDGGEIPADKLLVAIKDCCSKQPDFIIGELPILESVFRILLTSGNQPVSMKELGEKLSEWRGGYPSSNAGEKLSRLLASDSFYGLKKYQD